MDSQNNYHNEIHHLQFFDNEGDIPASITILVRQKNRAKNQSKSQVKSRPDTPISNDDLIDIHQELKKYKGDIRTLLK